MWIPEFLNGIFTTRNRGNCKNFAGSAALAEVCTVCGLQVLVVCVSGLSFDTLSRSLVKISNRNMV